MAGGPQRSFIAASAAAAAASVVAVITTLQPDASGHSAIGTSVVVLIYGLAALAGVAYVAATHTLPQALVAAWCVATCVAILAAELTTMGALDLWCFAVLLADGARMFDAPQWLPAVTTAVTAVYLAVRCAEEAAPFGLYDWGPDTGRYAAYAAAEKGGVSAVTAFCCRSLVIVVDLLVTRTLSGASRQQTEAMEALVDLTVQVTMRLAHFDTHVAQELDGELGESLPPPLREAYASLCSSIGEFRLFIPDAILHGNDGEQQPDIGDKQHSNTACTVTSSVSTVRSVLGSSFASAQPSARDHDFSISDASFSAVVSSRKLDRGDTSAASSLTSFRARQMTHDSGKPPTPAGRRSFADATESLGAAAAAGGARGMALGLARHGVTALHAALDSPVLHVSEPTPQPAEQLCGAFLSAAVSAARAHRGTLIEVRATGILAVWGLHNSLASARSPACDAAIAIAINVEGATAGVCYGVCISGNIGGESTRAHVVIGQAVDRAAVLAPLARYLRCAAVVDPAVREVARLRFKLRPIDVISEPQGEYEVWELQAPRHSDSFSNADREWMYSVADAEAEDSERGDTFCEAFAAMRSGDRDRALELLDAHLSNDADPGQQRCSDLLGSEQDTDVGILSKRRRSSVCSAISMGTGAAPDVAAARMRQTLLAGALPTPYSRRAPLPPFEVFPGESGSGSCAFDPFGVTQSRRPGRAGDDAGGPPVLAEVHRRLLHVLLPESIIERMVRSGANTLNIVDEYHSVSVIFADMVGYTARAASTGPLQLTRTLMEVFGAFDALCADCGLTKVKTIGDCYMAVAGAPQQRNNHGDCAVLFGLKLIRILAEYNSVRGNDLAIRVGINSGSVVGGVIGSRQLCFDLWGDAVNIAARMEQTGEPGLVQVSEATWRLLSPQVVGRADSEAELRAERHLTLKGRGQMQTHLLAPQGPTPRELRRYVSDQGQNLDDRLLEMLTRELMGF
eukprot:TRINITY_DN26403_c0_g1_i1.p1 TRINITY_DN26403_c0_g1~~TRINITY_DN26403_c0_g1_i1.p1  ORF type:complete len:1013 (+),score=320.39 TRINITY_DN26403_c0_g1_i1:138-3041(+)